MLVRGIGVISSGCKYYSARKSILFLVTKNYGVIQLRGITKLIYINILKCCSDFSCEEAAAVM